MIAKKGNIRHEKMWAIVNPHMNFKGKTVVDIGCGTGEMSWKAYEAGAGVVAIDIVDRMLVKPPDDDDFQFIEGSVEDMNLVPCDIIFCFSMLPYAYIAQQLAKDIQANCKVAFFEIQYKGDGFGFDWMPDDDTAEKWLLSLGFAQVDAIGRTEIKGRKKLTTRTIWMCLNDK